MKSSNTQSNPKTIKPQKELMNIPRSLLLCHMESCFAKDVVKSCLSKRATSSITLDQVSMMKEKKARKKKANHQDIAQSLKKNNEQVHGRDETLPEQQQVFRVKVVKHFFKLVCHLVKLTSSVLCLRRQVIALQIKHFYLI